MFNSLYGTLTHKGAENVFLLSPSGIEWDITVSTKTLGALPGNGEECRLYIYLLHREDAVKLFGFSSSDERLFFLELLKVSGIGPKQAMKMLSSVTVDQLAEALDRDDVELLAGIPGIGKKTAQKILLALRGKLVRTEEEIPEEKHRFGDIVNALSDMGFDRRKAQKAVDEVLKNSDTKNMKEDELEKYLFKQAIVMLST